MMDQPAGRDKAKESDYLGCVHIRYVQEYGEEKKK